LHRIAFCQTNRLFILLEQVETEIGFSMANGTFKMKMDIDRHGPRLMPNNCKNLNPPFFSLPTTFKAEGGCNRACRIALPGMKELLSCELLSTRAALVQHKQWIPKRIHHKTELLSLHNKPNIIYYY
jgi:hypothetical protein